MSLWSHFSPLPTPRADPIRGEKLLFDVWCYFEWREICYICLITTTRNSSPIRLTIMWSHLQMMRCHGYLVVLTTFERYGLCQGRENKTSMLGKAWEVLSVKSGVCRPYEVGILYRGILLKSPEGLIKATILVGTNSWKSKSIKLIFNKQLAFDLQISDTDIYFVQCPLSMYTFAKRTTFSSFLLSIRWLWKKCSLFLES